ncbi:hypothetical protein A5707_15105 [Mycobacterium kyorinense]|uniref:Uncharacterized protein n=1 Tax=Mycobacterium kyorinense TaxID=487514 RepID=A0A1A2ZMM3_9MYCO|nr:hypothetical protein A5707_15105 [Mycobacterium kyorinense]
MDNRQLAAADFAESDVFDVDELVDVSLLPLDDFSLELLDFSLDFDEDSDLLEPLVELFADSRLSVR